MYPIAKALLAMMLRKNWQMHRKDINQKNTTLPLLEALRVRHLVISFPTKSLAGQRNLTNQYRQLFYNIIKGQRWSVSEIIFKNELVFCVKKS